MTAVLVLVLAACSTAGGDTTTTTAPLTEPSTTTSTTSTSTTEPTTTTIIEDECTERDGLLRNRRGLICPPSLWAEGFPESGDPTHLPGRYETRLFEPAFSFHRDETFVSLGENPGKAVALDGATFPPWMYAIGSGLVDAVRSVDLGALDWVTDLQESATDISLTPATQIDFIVSRECETMTGECRIPIFDDLRITITSWTEGDKVRLLIVDRPEGPLAFEITSAAEDFDSYWTEVAQPILDSIEFLDP